MDDAMIGRLLQTYGAPTTARNANAARQFFATNPEIAEKRAMGMRGSGVDDNSDIFGAQLDKFIQQSEAAAPPGTVEVGAPQVEAKAAPTTGTPRQQQAAPTSRQGNYGDAPMNGASRQGNYDPPVTRQTARPGGGFGLDDILTALLGLTSVAGAAKMAPNTEPVAPKTKAIPRAVDNNGNLIEGPPEMRRLTYQPKLEDGGAQARADAVDQTKTITNDPTLNEQGRRAQLQAEIDAENADAQRLQDQIANRNKNQATTRELLKSAKRTVTGR